MVKKRLVVLSGAGISAESGLQTFRGSNGLWNGYDVYEVASPQGWEADYKLVLGFYNQRRQEIGRAQPNAGHYAVAALEQWFHVDVVTQNIDDLHERAGSSSVIHLHGEITKARSTSNPDNIYAIGYKDILPGDSCELGSQLRPHIVWFGEEVPKIVEASKLVAQADVLVITGTSLQVYPAAGLIHQAPPGCEIWLIDPEKPEIKMQGVHYIQAGSGEGFKIFMNQLRTTGKK